MDLWVVAAAAGAGYLAKYWNKHSKNSDGSSQLSLFSEESKFGNPETPSHPFHRHVWRDKLGKDVSSDLDSLGRLLGGEITCFGTYSKSNVLPVLNLPLPNSPNENFKVNEDENEQSSNIGGNNRSQFSDSSAEEVGSKHHSAGKRTSLRTRYLYRHFSRPVNSLESCLMAQLGKEHAKMEEYVFSSLPSPSKATRSFLVSDGSRIISRKSADYGSAINQSQEYELHMKDLHERDGNVFGVPSLPRIGSWQDPKKMKLKAGKKRSGRLNSSKSMFRGKNIQNQHDAMFIFSLGISFGIIISMMASKREVDSLRDLLKQTEHLVQDLQEELEMKDSVTVKELNNENYGSQDTCNNSFYEKELNGFSLERHMGNSLRNDSKELYYQREDESSGSMSKIEAELEAELERLGLNMNTSGLDRRLSDLVELDPDYEADFAQGELRIDTVQGEAFPRSESNEDATDIPTPLPGTYAVSPHELSLRLHEVIQSRLEARVKELEVALENSQRKVQMMEAEHCHLTTERSSANEDCDHPLVMNLSGEALDAYNEAYEELVKRDESEEGSPASIHDIDCKESSNSHGWSVSRIQHGGSNGSATHGGKMSREFASNKVTMLEGQSSGVSKLNVVTGDENSRFDYEMERQLIRKIVERTRKGSPVFQNAQRILYSVDEDEF